jgi:hypothetical protein
MPRLAFSDRTLFQHIDFVFLVKASHMMRPLLVQLLKKIKPNQLVIPVSD